MAKSPTLPLCLRFSCFVCTFVFIVLDILHAGAASFPRPLTLRYESLHGPGNLNYNLLCRFPVPRFVQKVARACIRRDARQQQQQRRAKKWNFMVTPQGFGRKLLFRVSTDLSPKEYPRPRPRPLVPCVVHRVISAKELFQ